MQESVYRQWRLDRRCDLQAAFFRNPLLYIADTNTKYHIKLPVTLKTRSTSVNIKPHDNPDRIEIHNSQIERTGRKPNHKIPSSTNAH